MRHLASKRTVLFDTGEEATVAIVTLTAYREVMSGLIQQFRGRVVDTPGDNLLAEFASVVDAVQCAVKVQLVLKAKDTELPENRRMAFRIGINLGIGCTTCPGGKCAQIR